MDPQKDNYTQKSTVIQIAVSVLANSGLFLSGMVLGIPSAILGPLVDSQAPGFHASLEDGTWIASVAAIASPIGCLLGGPLVDKFGRRRGLQILNVPNIIGWLLLSLVPFPFQSVYPLILGRILTGFGAGLATCAGATYTAEVVTPRLRTLLVTLSPIMMGLGIFFAYLMADLFKDQWLTAACIGTAVSIFAIMATPLLPESPLWLIMRNDLDGAHKSLMKLRGTTCFNTVEDEFIQMSKNASSRNITTTWKTTLENMCKPEAYKPLIIMNLFFLFQQLSGITIIIVYGVKFAKDAEIPKDAYTVALFIGVIRVFSTFITTWACNRWGRRKPAVSSCFGLTISLLGLTTYVFLRNRYSDSFPPNTWIPAACIILNIFTSSIGYSTLPWSMLGEVFPTNVRGVSSGLTSCIAYFISFIMIKSYPLVEDITGNIACFAFFGVFSFLGTIFLAIFLPETHKKSLQEIEDYFRGTKKPEKIDLSKC